MTTKEVLEDIVRNPHMHQHTHATLIVCCTVNGKEIPALRKAHEEMKAKTRSETSKVATERGICACGKRH